MSIAASEAVVPKPVTADMANLSHRGHVRARNEDCCRIEASRGFSIVADGVGGHGDGQWASQKVVALVTAMLSRGTPEDILNPKVREAIAQDALQIANDAMLTENAETGAASGSTVAGIWAPASTGWVTAFNVGDSPIFHLSQGFLQKVSRDHSLFQLWVDGGRMGKEPSKRMIVQAMGISEPLTPHLVSFAVAPGDSVLLCTDGLVGALSSERIAGLLLAAKSAAQACELLLQAALDGPAADNLTVSVCRF